MTYGYFAVTPDGQRINVNDMSEEEQVRFKKAVYRNLVMALGYKEKEVAKKKRTA